VGWETKKENSAEAREMEGNRRQKTKGKTMHATTNTSEQLFIMVYLHITKVKESITITA